MSETRDSKRKRPVETPVAAPQPAPPPAEKITKVTNLPQLTRRSPTSAADQLLASYHSTLASFGESQRAVASGVKNFALEMTGLVQTALTEAGDSAAALVRAGSVADAVEIQLGYVRRSFTSLIGGSARLSEIGAKLMSEASRPIVAPFGGSARTG
ncbi:MAG TPA: phasin family protein [Stellaceae bacterium]|nr:phasin family protein [Stellaceae bacterium]